MLLTYDCTFSVYSVAVLQRDLVLDAVAFAADENHVGVQRIAGAIEVFDELDDAAFVLEVVAFAVAFIQEFDAHAAVEKRQFLQSFVAACRS